MTYSEREEIFAKEVLSISDIQILFNITYQHAAQIMYFNIKTDRYASEEKY